MAESAALLVVEVLPEQPMRQWVLSFPFQLRFLFSSRPEIMGRVLGSANGEVETDLGPARLSMAIRHHCGSAPVSPDSQVEVWRSRLSSKAVSHPSTETLHKADVFRTMAGGGLASPAIRG